MLGWQPGIQEGTADWDENWDKFEDEGMSNCFWTFRVSLFFVKYILSIFFGENISKMGIKHPYPFTFEDVW